MGICGSKQANLDMGICGSKQGARDVIYAAAAETVVVPLGAADITLNTSSPPGAPRYRGDPCFDWGVVVQNKYAVYDHCLTQYVDSTEWHLYYDAQGACLFAEHDVAHYHFWRRLNYK